jgi:type I restriction enzyme S subunit
LGGKIGWITPKDLSTNDKIFVSKGERNITKKGLDKSSAKLLPKNTVLMTSRAPIGYTAIAKKYISTNQGFKSVICNEDIYDYLYFFYWLKNNMDIIRNNSSGSTFQEISATVFKNLSIMLPNLKNQKRISKILYGIDMEIENNRNINKNLT